MSLTVTSPVQMPSSSTTSSFSIRCLCSRRLASARSTDSATVTRSSLVISSRTGCCGLSAKRTSRWVMIPASRPLPRSTTGTPEMRWRFIRWSTSASVLSGVTVTGFTTMPDSYFLTLRTSPAWSAGSIFLCRTPMPPAWAMAMASLCSVTVSIAAETSGMPSRIDRVSRVPVSASAGSISERPGCSRTSSKVRASVMEAECGSSGADMRFGPARCTIAGAVGGCRLSDPFNHVPAARQSGAETYLAPVESEGPEPAYSASS